MSDFPAAILDYWRKAFDGTRVEAQADVALSVVATLDRKRPAMILEGPGNRTQAAMTPELADSIGWDASPMTTADWYERLANEGIVFHDPDFLFYLPADATLETDVGRAVRQLTEDDHAAFSSFHSSASDEDREDAYVELDHWAVFGCFDGDRLVSAASAILWSDGPIADLGVLTLPDARGRGCARAVVRAIDSYSRQQGYEPQYRCQLDNHASVALAKSCGLVLFGRWIVGTARSDRSDG